MAPLPTKHTYVVMRGNKPIYVLHSMPPNKKETRELFEVEMDVCLDLCGEHDGEFKFHWSTIDPIHEYRVVVKRGKKEVGKFSVYKTDCNLGSFQSNW